MKMKTGLDHELSEGREAPIAFELVNPNGITVQRSELDQRMV